MTKKYKIIAPYLYIVLTIVVLLGAYLKISHKSFGSELVLIGLVLGLPLLVYENTILKKKLKKEKDE